MGFALPAGAVAVASLPRHIACTEDTGSVSSTASVSADTSAYVRIRQHTKRVEHRVRFCGQVCGLRPHMLRYKSACLLIYEALSQHTPAYVSRCAA